MMNKYTCLMIVATVLAAACTESNEGNEQQVETVERSSPMSTEERLAMRRELQEPIELENVPESALADAAIIGEVPGDMLDKIYADLEKRTGGVKGSFVLQTAEAVQWPDGSLGCREPGMNYTHALVSGYRIVIRHQDQEYDYRATEQGFFKLCPGSGLTR